MFRLLLLVALFPALAAANECRFSAPRNADIDIKGLTTVAFKLGSSDVIVEGVPGLTKIEVIAKACASNESWLANLSLEQERSGDRVTLTPREDRDNNWNLFGSKYAYLDLRVRVPTSMGIDIKASSGDAEVRDVATLNFEASSGDLQVDKIAGTLALEVSSGDVRGAQIGNVLIHRTSSGDVSLRDVRGDVRVDKTGSGDLQFDNVDGAVNIGSVGSGDVSVSRVNGNVTVDSIGSGDVSVTDVGGDFIVHSKGSGDVRQRGVRGKSDYPRDDD